MPHDLQDDVDRVTRITAVPTILEVVCRTTGMGFAAVARVTEDKWVACAVLDEIDFGLKSGESIQSCGVHYDAKVTASSSFAGRKPEWR
jgi:hypothetical protein